MPRTAMSFDNNTIAEIQALRAIAVLLVVFYHGGISWFSGGYIGVDVFFVISGYLITGLLVREHTNSGGISLPRFYARRIRRLFPAAAVTVIAVSVAGWFLYSPLEFKQLTSTAIATTVYLSNFWFFQIATDYLAAEPHTNPLLHTWSLSVEEQFYLFWPLLIIGLTKLGRSSDISRRVMLGLAGLSLVSLVLCVLHTKSNQPLAFFGTHARAWEFGIGGMLALVHARGVTPAQGPRNVLFLVGLLLIFVSSFAYNDRTTFPGFAAFWPVLGTALVMHSCSGGGASAFNGWMKLKPVQYIGDVSYSFYLWHWPVVIALHGYVDELGVLWVPFYIGISLLLAALSYHFVENPVRFSGVLTSKIANSYYFGLAISLLVLCSVGVGRMATVQELEKGSQVAYRNATKDNARIYNDGCHLDELTTVIPETCVYGASDGSRSIALFGDSHAANWFPAFEKLAWEQGYKLYSLTKSGCPSFLNLEPFDRNLNRQYTECTQWRENALQFIADKEPDLVILANSDTIFKSDNGKSRRGVKSERLIRSIDYTSDWLHEAGISFVVIRDIPRINFEPLSCLSRAAWKGKAPAATCTFPSEDEANKMIFDLIAAGFAGTDRGVVLDMNNEICPRGGTCVLERDGLVLYRDSHHLTASFSKYLSSLLLKQLRGLGMM